MMYSSFKSLSKCFFSRIQCRALTSQVNAKINKQMDINNGNYSIYNCRNGLESRKSFLSNPRPILTNLGHANSRNLGVKNFSTASIYETLNTVSKYSEGTPVEWFQHFLVWTRLTTGLPWWATIIINAAVLRICMLTPLKVYKTHILTRVQNVRTEMEGDAWKLEKKVLQNANSKKYSQDMAQRDFNRQFRDGLRKLYKRDNCHPVKAVRISIVQFAITLCQFSAIYNLCQMLPASNFFPELIQLELSVGGFGWIRDLTHVDSYYLIPIYLSLLSFTRLKVIHLFTQTFNPVPTKLEKLLIVVLPLITFVLSSFMPAGVLLSWATINTLALGEFFLFFVPKFRRAMGIPVLRERNRPLKRNTGYPKK